MTAFAMGHKNPDTDSVVSAIVLADLQSKRGIPTEPAMQGELAPESVFVLERFGFDSPQIVSDVAGKDIFLVDHSDVAQAPQSLDEANLLGIVDHHKLGDITTSQPLEMWVLPVGCSNTVLKNMYDFYHVEIPSRLAGIMLCAILSDTVLFKSVTCTDMDRKAANDLARIAGVDDVEALGMEMFKVKSAVEGTPAKELLNRDYKDFDMSGHKVGIGQLEMVDLSIVESAKDDLYAAMEQVKSDGGHHSILLLLTDIMKEGSEMLVLSDDPSVVQRAFGAEVQGRSVWLDGIMSRKKQVVPELEKAFK